MSPANLTLRFPLELALLAALAIWGAHAGAAGVLSAILAVVGTACGSRPLGHVGLAQAAGVGRVASPSASNWHCLALPLRVWQSPGFRTWRWPLRSP